MKTNGTTSLFYVTFTLTLGIDITYERNDKNWIGVWFNYIGKRILKPGDFSAKKGDYLHSEIYEAGEKGDYKTMYDKIVQHEQGHVKLFIQWYNNIFPIVKNSHKTTYSKWIDCDKQGDKIFKYVLKDLDKFRKEQHKILHPIVRDHHVH